MSPAPHHRHAAVDGGAQAVELLLIVGHDPLHAAGVQVPGDLRQGKAARLKLGQGPLKQVPVVRFEVDGPAGGQHLAVEGQEIGMGQPPLGVAVARPGVAEIDVDAVHLAGSEIVGQPGCVCVHKKYVGQLLGAHPLHGDHHSVGHPLHRDQQCIRRRRRRAGGEASLAAPSSRWSSAAPSISFAPVPGAAAPGPSPAPGRTAPSWGSGSVFSSFAYRSSSRRARRIPPARPALGGYCIMKAPACQPHPHRSGQNKSGPPAAPALCKGAHRAPAHCLTDPF